MENEPYFRLPNRFIKGNVSLRDREGTPEVQTRLNKIWTSPGPYTDMVYDTGVRSRESRRVVPLLNMVARVSPEGPVVGRSGPYPRASQ